ncbi:serine hydrolase domain-containing protein [Ekhidna sp.]
MKFFVTVFTTLLIQVASGQDLGGFVLKTTNEFRDRFKVPGLAVGIIFPDTTFMAVSGVKRNGSNRLIDFDSKFQLASNTKAITATIAADLVEDGVIEWDSKLLDVVPELSKCHESYHNLTLSQLLNHRAMLPAFEDNKSKEWRGIPKGIENSINPRLAYAEYALDLEPMNIGTHSYSNAGYIIAALMLEKATNKQWSQLVFDFCMKIKIDAFCGFPAEEDLEETNGHQKKVGDYKPVDFDQETELGSYFSPSGNFSLSIRDLSKVVGHHLEGLLGIDNVLKSETYEYLHYGYEEYSLGWYNGNVGDTDQRFSYHGGSLGTFSSAVLISPDRKLGIVILVNADGRQITDMKNELRIKLWDRFKNITNRNTP